MSAIDGLLANYSRQVRLPWSTNMSGKQRIWFAVYPPAEERRVRARLPQFEAITLEAHHGWASVDLTRLLPEWITAHEYREAIFSGSSHKCVHDSAPAGRPRRGKRVRMRSCQLTSGAVVCRSVDGRLRGPSF